MSRDEGFYVDAADRYGAWLELFWTDASRATERAAVDAHWEVNHEHPSLAKSMFALFHLADEKWDLFPVPSMGYRFFGMLTGGLLLWLIYIFGARAFGRLVGAFAAAAFALMPRIFYHSHLDCFDVPIVLMMTLVTYCYWRSLTDARWAIWTGLAYGLALATKHNAWTLPVIFLVHWWFVVWTELAARKTKWWVTLLALAFPLAVVPALEILARVRGEARRLRLVPWWLVAMITMGPPIFVLLWPWMWFDTLARFGEYAGFHFNHVYYNMAYFGVNYFQPPFPISYPWVMTLFTVPLVTILLAVGGLGLRLRALLPPALADRAWPSGAARSDPAGTDLLFFGSLLAPLVVISMPWTPIFGGTKHWFSAYPFLALFAGVGFAQVTRAAKSLAGEAVPRAVRRGAVAAILLAPALVETSHSHPFGLSHYGFAAGGVPGAADYGMNRQFWGFTTGSLVDFFNAQMPEGGSVWICDTTWSAWRMLQRDERLSESIRATGDLPGADFAIVHHEHHFAEVDYQIWQAFGSVAPVHVLTYDGVPIVSVYESPRHRARRAARAAQAQAAQGARGGPVR
ncbi:MAG: glycosyltransferase family 39 protein [Sandaracinaceae bacterium]|nr:glycosyltransferase family 39 protein [Sandaracinaceae bacterium]